MKSNKWVWFLLFAGLALPSLISGFLKERGESQQKAKIESVLSSVIQKAVEGTPDPKPTLSFVTMTDKTLGVVLQWSQKPEAAIKNDMRERVITAVRAELSTDQDAEGRFIFVSFDDEIVTRVRK